MAQSKQQKKVQLLLKEKEKKAKFGLNASGKISDKFTKADLIDAIPDKNHHSPFGKTFRLTPNTGVRVIYDKGHPNIPNPIEGGYVVEKVKDPTSRSGSQHTPIVKVKTATVAKLELMNVLRKAKRLEEP